MATAKAVPQTGLGDDDFVRVPDRQAPAGPAPQRPPQMSCAQARWLEVAAARGPSLAAHLVQFVGPAQGAQSWVDWAVVAEEARAQVAVLVGLRQPLHDSLRLPLPEPCWTSEVVRRQALGQTDAELCALVHRWVQSPVAAIAQLPHLGPPPPDARGAAARLHMHMAELAGMSLSCEVARAMRADRRATPQPQLVDLAGAQLRLSAFVDGLRQARGRIGG